MTDTTEEAPTDLLHGRSIRAFLFDLDGVLTPTAEVHMHAWADDVRRLLRGAGRPPPYTERDYFDYIDGKPRYDGVRDLLRAAASRCPGATRTTTRPTTRCAASATARTRSSTRCCATRASRPTRARSRFLDALAGRGTPVAVVSSSKNAPAVLAAAGIADRFQIVMDGEVAAERGLPGKPAPERFSQAATELGVDRAASVVVEDAIRGVAVRRAPAASAS